ncbi:MAG: hypothetical protein D6765_07370 [Bacteroidetes bacterium]|nr:MAG: hypothetical protein D6765_07370 [Bacteroidota bacterium]
MMKKMATERLEKARQALQATLSKILDINKKRKAMAQSKVSPRVKQELEAELQLLNKVAERQARLVELYKSSNH